MRRNILLVTSFVLVSLNAYSQAIITFEAGAGKIRYTTDGTASAAVPIGNPASIPGFGTINIALYSAPAGTALNSFGGVPDLSGPWAIQTSPLLQEIEPLAGAVTAINVTLDSSSGAPGADVELEAVYWTGNYTTFQQALTGGSGLLAWSGSAASGGAFGWQQASGTTLSPEAITFGSAGFNGLVNSIPEPGTIVLGGLGAAGLLIFRRRK